MIRLILTILLLTFNIHCGSTTGSDGNNLTEVGSPTSPSDPNTPTPSPNKAIASATTKTLAQITDNLFSTLSLNSNLSNVSIQTDNFDCTYTLLSKTLECQCPDGGTMTRVFDSSFSFQFGGRLTLNHTHTTTYTDCALTTCEEELVLNGEITGNLSGTFNRQSDALDIESNNQTDSSCSGLASEDYDFGYNIDITYDGSDITMSGSLCIDDESIDFTSIENLQDQVDEDNECEDFGP